MKRLYILLPLVFLIFGIALLLNKYVSAQDAGQGLEVSPPSQEAIIDPGKTITVKAKIKNKSNRALPMQVHIEDFTAKGEEGQVQLTTKSSYNITSWTTVSPSDFKLGPGEVKEVTATIKAPIDAAGGRFGSFVFGIKPDNVGDNTAAVTQQIASLFLVKVNGSVTENLVIKDFTAPEFSEFGPVPLAIKFENKGNVHTKAYGLINVTDIFGNKVEDIVVSGTNVFPDATRIVNSSLNKQFLIGKYTATALIYYGSTSTQSLNATTTFIVFPVRIAVGVVIVLLILFLLRKRLKKATKALVEK